MKTISKLLNKNGKCFIIAEAGVNHNGSFVLAKKMIDAAKTTGVDAVKFQTFTSENFVTGSTPLAEYQKKNIGKKESQITMLKKLELNYNDFTALKNYCDKIGIIFLSTAHTEDAADFLAPLVPAFKVGSGDLNNFPFLEKLAKSQKWIILSTGMADINEIETALKTIRKTSKKKISLLHCTTNYPCRLDEVNLLAMNEMKKRFERKFAPLEIGYSDHTEGIMVSAAAVALGAKVIEKHFTLDKNMRGPDHKASLEPNELKKMVKQIRDMELVLGSGIKKPFLSEEKTKKTARKSIVANANIKKGEIIKKNMLIIKRPGTGIEPKYFSKILGRKAKKDIKKDELIFWNQI